MTKTQELFGGNEINPTIEPVYSKVSYEWLLPQICGNIYGYVAEPKEDNIISNFSSGGNEIQHTVVGIKHCNTRKIVVKEK